ncbi:activator of HSP90 ATPase [Filimonas zeae]|uniref:Activator of HSP90 ATPase n=2 Tax=Filimonas zeae TaxID=1737353 RepID=A0A917MZ09_9BACT|nr:activator of HSP90 ATPase [Filimonas zeae]
MYAKIVTGKFDKKIALMANILHRIGVKTSSAEQVYAALTSRNGLAGWWTNNTTGEGNAVGNTIQFRFGAGGFDMKVIELQAPVLVVWEVVDGPEEWQGTKIRFELKPDGEYVIVLFSHLNWQTPNEFMHHCSTKWAIFLMSLKQLVETGEGNPDPYDIKIDNWN